MPEILVYLVFTMSIIVSRGSVLWSRCVHRVSITNMSVSIDCVYGVNKFPSAVAHDMYHFSSNIYAAVQIVMGLIRTDWDTCDMS